MFHFTNLLKGRFLDVLFWRGDFFLTHYFCELFFHEGDITCIITVVGAQEQHKGMFLKHKGGGGAKIFQQCHGGWGGGFFSCGFSSRGGALFFLPSDFADPHPTPRP